MQNWMRRNLESDSTCHLCGIGEEDVYNAVVACTKSRALRDELRKDWELISEDMLVRSGVEWFLLLLDKLDIEARAHVFFCFWRAWHLRNDALHGKGSALVEASASFVKNY